MKGLTITYLKIEMPLIVIVSGHPDVVPVKTGYHNDKKTEFPPSRLCHNREKACIVIPDLIRNPVFSRYYKPLDPESSSG